MSQVSQLSNLDTPDQSVCEHPHVERLARAGRTRSFAPFARLELPAALNVLTCADCGEVFARTDKDAEAIDQALDAASRTLLRNLATQKLDKLRQAGIPQRDLERHLQLSPGYLSKVKVPKDSQVSERTPSARLVAVLALLGKDPRARMRELDEVWNPSPVQRASATVPVPSASRGAPVLVLCKDNLAGTASSGNPMVPR